MERSRRGGKESQKIKKRKGRREGWWRNVSIYVYIMQASNVLCACACARVQVNVGVRVGQAGVCERSANVKSGGLKAGGF